MVFMGVRKEHEGRGVASQLTKRSLEAVEAEGYKAVYAEATAYGSQAILRDK
jgi:predicted N-acetyltransferase YhbS